MLALELQVDEGNDNELSFAGPQDSADSDADKGAVAVEEEEAEDPPPQTQRPPKRRKAARQSAAGQPSQAANQDSGETEGACKKCTGPCGKRKLQDQFNDQQSKCKDCNLDIRSFWYTAQSQDCQTEMKTLETEDPAEFNQVLKAFVKERQKAKTQAAKVKFNITSFRKSLVAKSGDRAEQVKEMMWEGEFLENARTAKFGYLTKEEAELKWKQYMSDPSVKKDKEGPRGYTRCAVPCKTLLTEFDEVAHQKELSQTERLSKTATKETIAARTNMVLSEAADPAQDSFGSVQVNEIRAKAQASGVDFKQLAGQDVAAIAEAQAAKRRRGSIGSRKHAENEASNSEEEEEAAASADERREKSKKEEAKRKAKWFDAETQIRKAERAFAASVEGLEKSVQTVIQEVQTLLGEVRGSQCAAEKEDFKQEIQILQRRVEWLQAVLDGESALAKLLEDHGKSTKSGDADEAGTTSRDMSAVHRAGPCKDFESIKSFEQVKHAANFRGCTCKEEIANVQAEGNEMKKHINTLLTAVKAAKHDLVGARKRKELNKKKNAEKAEKAAKAAAKKKADGVAASGPDHAGGPASNKQSGAARRRVPPQGALLDASSSLWSNQGFMIPSLEMDQPWDPDMVALRSGIGGTTAATQRILNFTSVFSASTLKVTEGRAHAVWQANTPNTEEEWKEIAQHFQEKARFPSSWQLQQPSRSGSVDQAGSGNAVAMTKLNAALNISTFGLAACSVSHARTEAALLPCLRWISSGSMMVAVHVPKDCSKPEAVTAAQQLLQKGSEEILEAARSGQLRVGTVGSDDLIYFPPGSIVSLRVHAQDVLGLRVGILGSGMTQRLEELSAAVVQQPQLLAVLAAACEKAKALKALEPEPATAQGQHSAKTTQDDKIEAQIAHALKPDDDAEEFDAEALCKLARQHSLFTKFEADARLRHDNPDYRVFAHQEGDLMEDLNAFLDFVKFSQDLPAWPSTSLDSDNEGFPARDTKMVDLTEPSKAEQADAIADGVKPPCKEPEPADDAADGAQEAADDAADGAQAKRNDEIQPRSQCVVPAAAEFSEGQSLPATATPQQAQTAPPAPVTPVQGLGGEASMTAGSEKAPAPPNSPDPAAPASGPTPTPEELEKAKPKPAGATAIAAQPAAAEKESQDAEAATAPAAAETAKPQVDNTAMGSAKDLKEADKPPAKAALAAPKEAAPKVAAAAKALPKTKQDKNKPKTDTERKRKR